MNEIEKFGNGKPGKPVVISSRDIADKVKATHDNVLKTIRSLVERGVVSGNETPYVHPQNGQTYVEIFLDFRNMMVVVSGYSAELRAAVIDRWQELEAKAANPFADMLPKNFSEAVQMLACTLKENEVLAERTKEMEKDIKIFEPKAAALDRIACTDGTFNLTNAAKDLNLAPQKLIEWMSRNGWIYKRPCTSNWVAYQDKITRGFLVHKTYVATKADGTERICDQVRVTGKGIANLSLLLNNQNGVSTN